MIIINIRQGEGKKIKFIYADLVDNQGRLIISATLDYITSRLQTNFKLYDDEKDKI